MASRWRPTQYGLFTLCNGAGRNPENTPAVICLIIAALAPSPVTLTHVRAELKGSWPEVHPSDIATARANPRGALSDAVRRGWMEETFARTQTTPMVKE